MPTSFAHRLFALLCLITLGIAQCASGLSGVTCEDNYGRLSFEFTCIKTTDGSCQLTCDENSASLPCDDEHQEHSPRPCKDTPIGTATPVAKVLTRLQSIDPLPFVAVVFCLSYSTAWEDVLVSEFVALAGLHARPPDAIAALRTIIMTV